jgi:gamma-glutamyltranspeptidase/glutathione hydrolase
MKIFKFYFLAFLLFVNTACGQNTDQPLTIERVEVPQHFYTNGVVASANEYASQVGLNILMKGGNAIDAAVAVGFALAVVYPQAGNIGGGGFMVIHTDKGVNTTIDYREKAPLLAHRDMYLDAAGNVISDLSLHGHLAAGVPGSVAGLLYALERYGTMSRAEVMNFAIDLAENGFVINEKMADALNEHQKKFSDFASTKKVFGGWFKRGDQIVQKDLAETLRRIRDNGYDGFYKGKTAELIVNEMKKGSGIISYEDLADYQPVERDPVKGTYRGYEVISMGPPSSGGISLIYLLNILENYNLKHFGHNSAENTALMTEAMRRVYADRSEFMGDMDFVNVPIDILTSKKYAKERMRSYTPGTASKSSDIKHGDAYHREGTNTTHYSVADKNGNLVSVTTTLNDNFGNKVVVEGAGFFLNNEMDDFVSKPGVPNMFGLLGNEANAIAPGKRMLSSMTPTIVLKDGKPFLVTGSPGGGRIITTVLHNIVNVIDYGLDLTTAIDMPRFHHQWYPDEIQAEKNSISPEVRAVLEGWGYKVTDFRDYASLDAILFTPQGMIGHSDRRGSGQAVGY